MVLHQDRPTSFPCPIYNSRNYVWLYTESLRGCRLGGIYNSRNFVWLYTHRQSWQRCRAIYNSRNFVWLYTYNQVHRPLQSIYNSRNFVWLYTATGKYTLQVGSTIVEILYGFTPQLPMAIDWQSSTIVEILYGFTPPPHHPLLHLHIYNSRNFVWLYITWP